MDDCTKPKLGNEKPDTREGSKNLVLNFELKSHEISLFIWYSIIINAIRMANAFDVLSSQFKQLYQESFLSHPPSYVHIIHTNVR